jgi:type I restriction enzyme M protein
MSEELLQIAPHQIGRYSYYRLGSSTLSQLCAQKIIGCKIPKALTTKKPDGLVVLSGGTVKAVVEYKQSSELKSARLVAIAVKQELEVARYLCKLLIVSDGERSYWINALTGNPIIDKKGAKVRTRFDVGALAKGKISYEESQEIERLIDMAAHSLSETNDVLEEPRLLDPTPLAKSIWQRIWINTGKEPEKCLYNVVEFSFSSFLAILVF